MEPRRLLPWMPPVTSPAAYNPLIGSPEVSITLAYSSISTPPMAVSYTHLDVYKRQAKNRGVKKIVVTHVDFPTTYYTVEEQKRFVEMGAVMEHCYTTWATGKVEFEVTKEMIREIGPANCILATDLGQKTALYPDGYKRQDTGRATASGVCTARLTV